MLFNVQNQCNEMLNLHLDKCKRSHSLFGDNNDAQPFPYHLVHTEYSIGFPHSSVGKEFSCNAGDLGSIPGLGRSPGEGKGHPLQYSGLENSTECIVHESQRIGHDWPTFTLVVLGSILVAINTPSSWINFLWGECVFKNKW